MTDGVATSGSGSPWAGPLAGLAGGLICGAVDGLSTLSARIPGLGGTRSVWFLVLCMALGGAAGLLFALVAAVVAAAAKGIIRRSGGNTTFDRVGAAVTVILAAPLVTYDSFALFTGAQAARVPGHHILSVVLALGGAVLLAQMGGRVGPAVARLRQARGSWWVAVTVVSVATLLAGTAYWANRAVLPRLYPWFHLTLSLAFVALCVLAVRLARWQRPTGRWEAPLVFGLFAVTGALLGLSLPRMQASQSLRFALHEKTVISSMVLKAVPLVTGRRVGRDFERRSLAPLLAPLREGPHRPHADVVLVTIDAVRADHVGAYGYGRATTPNIDALAKRGVRFERVYAQAPHTSFSVASMLTGKYYPTIARLAPGDAHDPVAEVLRQYGWKTAAFYPPAVFFVDANKLRAYQDNNFRFEYVKVEFLDANKRLDQISTFLDQEKPERLFLWLHLFEPHEPYDQRDGFAFGKTDMDRYDSEIAYADAAVGRLLAYLQRKRPGAIVILAADHGEAFDEHKRRYHGTELYEEQLRIPLVIAVPGVPPHVISNPVELLDVAPTVLGLLDIPIPVRMRGTDLGPWLASPPAPEDRLPPAFAEVEDKRMVAWRREKLICELNWGYCAYYDLTADPGEETNLADARPDRVVALRQMLDVWLDDHSRYEPQLLRGQANPEGGTVPKPIERGRLGDLGSVMDLAAMLDSAQPLPVRREAARLLATTLPPRKETRDLIERALGNADVDIADWAAVAAGRLGVVRAVERLRAVLSQPASDDRARDLHVQAAFALTYVGDGQGVPVLADALDACENVRLCRDIIVRLGTVRDKRAVPALLKHLSEVLTRREIVVALGEIADPVVVPTLVEHLLGDEYVPVREEAARALGKIGGDAALAGLKDALSHEHEAPVLSAVRAAVVSLRQAKAAADATRPQSRPAATPGRAHSLRSAPGR